MNNLSEKLLAATPFVWILAAVLLLGTMGEEDEDRDMKVYCENVRDAVWPDYKEIYESVCRGVE